MSPALCVILYDNGKAILAKRHRDKNADFFFSSASVSRSSRSESRSRTLASTCFILSSTSSTFPLASRDSSMFASSSSSFFFLLFRLSTFSWTS